MSWAEIDVISLQALAICLPFADASPPSPPSNHTRSPFLSLARTCRRLHHLLTTLPTFWSTQRPHFDLSTPLLSLSDFVPLDPPTDLTQCVPYDARCLRVDRFDARQQETLLRLLGHDAFHRLITPRMKHTRAVALSRYVDAVDEDGIDVDPHTLAALRAAAATNPHTTTVYDTLVLALFEFAEPQRAFPTGGGGGGEGRGRSVSWVRGCYTALLQPACVALAPAATVTLGTGPEDVQLDCLYRTLQRLPALAALTLTQCEVALQPSRQVLLAPWRWETVSGLLPRLRLLVLQGVAVTWEECLRPLMTAELGELRSLLIDTKHTFLCGDMGSMYWDDAPLTFLYPPRPDERSEVTDTDSIGETGNGCDDDEGDDISAVQMRLQLALCRHVFVHLESVANRADGNEELFTMLEECSLIQAQIVREQLAMMAVGEQPYAIRAAYEYIDYSVFRN